MTTKYSNEWCPWWYCAYDLNAQNTSCKQNKYAKEIFCIQMNSQRHLTVNTKLYGNEIE